MTAFAKDLAMLFVDVPCASNTPTPLAKMATCAHPPNTQHIEKPASFGGTAGTKYTLGLRVRGIWEPTSITGGEHPKKEQPFTIGGKVTGGSGSSSDAINYQQYSIEVSDPKQTYWLNDYQYVAHDIHKEDYQISIPVAGGASLKVIMHDGNDHEIANWTKDLFSDVPPYDKMPSLGQSLRLDVVSVTPQ
jgi:hypothetical protein